MSPLLDEGPSTIPKVQTAHEFMFHFCGVHLNAIRWTEPRSGRVWKLHYFQPKVTFFQNLDISTVFTQIHKFYFLL